MAGNAAAGAGVTGTITTIKRTDGTTQATYDGHPLYTYIGDNAPGKDSRQQHQPERRALARRAGLGRVTDPRPRMGRVSLPFPEVPFPEVTVPASSRAEVFLRYLDYFRSRLASKLEELPAAELRSSRLPTGWTPLELAKHLRYVELRWLEWGFEGRDVGDPWADHEGDRWHVGPDETLATLLADLAGQAARSRAIIESHDLDELGQPGERWDGADPATLERVLFHLLQEYARHVGHIDVVTELAVGRSGE